MTTYERKIFMRTRIEDYTDCDHPLINTARMLIFYHSPTKVMLIAAANILDVIDG